MPNMLLSIQRFEVYYAEPHLPPDQATATPPPSSATASGGSSVGLLCDSRLFNDDKPGTHFGHKKENNKGHSFSLD
ncbi:hypothetical protein L6164_002033 [Bauhinia variegata]|uniref:Uncharacterized protein n=1 Tax=Bauhinia variegata TaxID=167791 RepID=A0ACB9PXH0_BAUVA|nr:hypothetical protein L6164_002033 [Bauhinia variegata]